MADVPVPSIATATPDGDDTVLGVKDGVVRRFTLDNVGAGINFSNINATTDMAFNNAGVERMRITSAGNVGIGTTSPGAKLTVAAPEAIRMANASPYLSFYNSAQSVRFGYAQHNGTNLALVNEQAGSLELYTSNTLRATLDASGNLGLGVAPSASTSTVNLQVKGTAVLAGNSSGAEGAYLTSNAIFNSGWKYISTAASSRYEQGLGSHAWYTAPSGTAGNPITFTQAMTLDASGNLAMTGGGVVDAASFRDYSNTAYYLDPANTGTSMVVAGNVGIGTTSPTTYSAKLVTAGAFGSSNPAVSLVNTSPENAGNIAEIQYWLANSFSGLVSVAKIGAVSGTTGNQYGSLYFSTSNAGAPVERMRLDSAGNLLVGTATASLGASGRGLTETNGTNSSINALKVNGVSTAYFGAFASVVELAVQANVPLSFLTNNTERARIDTSGNLAMTGGGAVDAASFRDYSNTAYYLDPANTGTSLNVAGSVVAAGNVTAYSDIRVKANIEPIHGALDKLSQINGVTYTRTDLDDKERRYGGVIAQEIEAVLPEAVFDDGVKKAVDYNATIGLLIQAVKEQQAQIEELKLALSQIKGN